MNTSCFKKCLAVFDEVRPTSKETNEALLFVRIATALFFITHGYAKFSGEMGLDSFTGMLEGMGIPMAGVVAFLVAFAELFGGIAILLGVLTRFSAFWLTVIAAYALFAVKGAALPAGDLDVLALGLTLSLLSAGPGALSLSAYMKNKKGGQQAGIN